MNIQSDEVMAELQPFGRLSCIAINGPVSDKGLSKLRNQSKLKELRIVGADISDDGIEVLKHLRNLESLMLAECSISDSGLKHLSDLTHLRSLDLTRAKVTDVGVTHLRQLRGLKELRLTGTTVSDEGLKQLADLKQLDEIHIDGTPVTAAGLAHLMIDLQGRELDEQSKWLPGLYFEPGNDLVELNGEHFTDEFVPYLQRIVRVNSLTVSHTLMTGEGLSQLTEMQQLTFSGAEIKKVENLPTLEKLYLRAPDPTLISISDLPKLTELSCGNFGDSNSMMEFDKLIERLTGFECLVGLELENADISDDEVRELAKLKRLTRLNLGGVEIGDGGLAVLSNLHNLESLQIRGTAISTAGVANLEGLEELRFLGLSWNILIGDDVVPVLAEMGRLDQIDLNGCATTNQGLRELRRLLPNYRISQSVFLPGVPAGTP